MAPAKAKGKTSDHLKSTWPLLRELIRPRRGMLVLGFGLMLINKLCSLVLPGSPKFLVDYVINGHRPDLLGPLVGAIFAANSLNTRTRRGTCRFPR